jgi:FKBP-type peptidyl-prolyl cis-trans isomerase
MRNVVWVTAIGAVAIFVSVTGCTKRVEEPPTADFKPTEAPPLPPGPDKLEIVDEVVGTGAEVKKDDRVKVHYTGTLMNGKMFDSSRGKDPFPVTVGAGQVIKGWDQGLPGMKVGGKRKLTIPWADAYGEKGSPPSIPPKAALKFDIELLEILSNDDAGTKDGGPAPKAAAKDAGAKK